MKVLRDINVQCDSMIEATGILFWIDKKERKGVIIDIVVPADVRVGEKESEKVENYRDL